MNFFDELKRRNVIRVGIAYVVVAWLIMQFADVVLNNIEAPGWVFQVIMLVLAIGFPVVIIFAWAFEMTPEGIKKERDVDRSQSIAAMTGRKLDRMIIGIMAVVIAFLVLDRFVLRDESGETPAAIESQIAEVVEAPEPVVETGPSVAVLPFVNMSGDANNEYFSDGLTETLLHMLAQLPELRVAARTSSFAFKGKDTGISEISKILGVAHVLEGSVQKAGNRVRITAQLIRADDGFHVWSQSYDRTLDDIFAIQDEIANDVASALDLSLLGTSTPSLHGVATRNTNAYDFYLRALEQQAVFSYSSLATAENLLKNALALDPGFIDAKLALARNYQKKFGTGLIDEDTAWQSMEPLLQQVEKEHPGDPLTRALTLNYQLRAWSFDLDAERQAAVLDELRSLLPKIASDTWVRVSVAGRLGFNNEFEDALAVIQAGLVLDPLSESMHSALGDLYRDMERFEDARAAYNRALELAPDNPNVYSDIGEVVESSGDLIGALDWFRQAIEKDPQDHELVAQMATKLFQLGLVEEGTRWASRCYAVAPQTVVSRKLQLDEARARNDSARRLELATAMIRDDVELRRFGFSSALFNYVDLMTEQGRAKEAFEYLVSRYPDMDDFEQPPENLKPMVLRRAAVLLLSQFAPLDEFSKARDLFFKHQSEAQVPWLNSPRYRINKHLMYGDIEQAKLIALNEDLSTEPANSLGRDNRYKTMMYRELSQIPEVAARIRARQAEFAVLRSDVEIMMLKPEWNQ